VYNTCGGNEWIFVQICLQISYICICDSLIIGNFGNPLHFVEIDYYTRFNAHSITKINVSQFNSSVLPSVTPSIVYKYSSLDLSLALVHHPCSASPRQTSKHFFLSYHEHFLSHHMHLTTISYHLLYIALAHSLLPFLIHPLPFVILLISINSCQIDLPTYNLSARTAEKHRSSYYTRKMPLVQPPFVWHVYLKIFMYYSL
jgi:hypothetical protein